MLPFRFPGLQRVDHIDRAGGVTMQRLCEMADTPYRTGGALPRRLVVVHVVQGSQYPLLRAERDDYSGVEIGVPRGDGDPVDQARWALGCMAYSPLADLVALASWRGQDWARWGFIDRGRKPLSKPMRLFVDEVTQVYRRHGFAIGTVDRYDSLTIGPLTDEALNALRRATPTWRAR